MTFNRQERRIVLPEHYDEWMDLHDTIKWTFARSMPKTPHYYMIRGKTVSEEVYTLAFGVRRTWGDPGKFYGRTQLYLHHRDNSDIRYWSLDRFLCNSEIMNMAKDGKTYGPQDAPITRGHGWAEYDAVAAWWDDEYLDLSGRDRAAIWKLVHRTITAVKPTLIDIGAGTGGTLDARVTGSEETLAIDPSQGMLNDLIQKYPNIREVYPGTFGQWAEQADRQSQARDVVMASHGSASYLTPEEIAAAPEFAKQVTVLSFYAEVPSHRTDLPRTHDDALTAALSLSGARSVTAGAFTYVLVR